MFVVIYIKHHAPLHKSTLQFFMCIKYNQKAHLLRSEGNIELSINIFKVA